MNEADRDAIRALGDRLSTDVEARDRRGAKDVTDVLPLWEAAASCGVLGWAMPKTYGGAALSTHETVERMMWLGENCRDNGMLLALNGQMWAMQKSIEEFGSSAQKADLLPDLVSGKRLCAHAVTETASGSNAMAMQTRAERSKDGYLLNGEKIWVGTGPAAHIAQVFAVTHPDRGPWGLSVFIVDLTLPGVTRDTPYEKVGHRTVPAGTIRFDNVALPEEARLGPEGAGQSIFNRSIDWERKFIFAGHVGAMRRQLAEAVTFARNRKPGGTPIDTFQSVSNRLADMRLRHETCRLMIENAAREIDLGAENKATGALVKLHVSEALFDSAEDGLRLLGGAGYLSGDAERQLRDAAGCVTLGGTSDIQRRVIAAFLQASF